jgi:alkyl hydroperoxide reductase subunit D
MTNPSAIENLDELFPEKTSAIARDLRLNLKRMTEESALDRTDAALALLACATSVNDPTLCAYARKQLTALEIPAEQIAEAAESAAIMGMLNIYYRFRHFVSHGQGEAAVEPYKTAGLRMTALARPTLGKERFEMLAFAVSCINGCENCVNAHERTLREHGTDPAKIHDLARIAAIVKGIETLARGSC